MYIPQPLFDRYVSMEARQQPRLTRQQLEEVVYKRLVSSPGHYEPKLDPAKVERRIKRLDRRQDLAQIPQSWLTRSSTREAGKTLVGQHVTYLH